MDKLTITQRQVSINFFSYFLFSLPATSVVLPLAPEEKEWVGGEEKGGGNVG